MIHTEQQYKTLADRFNKMSFLQKLLTIKNNKELFTVETDGYNIRLRLEEEAQKLELDLLFSFPTFLEYQHLKDIFSLVDINTKELK